MRLKKQKPDHKGLYTCRGGAGMHPEGSRYQERVPGTAQLGGWFGGGENGRGGGRE